MASLARETLPGYNKDNEYHYAYHHGLSANHVLILFVFTLFFLFLGFLFLGLSLLLTEPEDICTCSEYLLYALWLPLL